MRQSRIYTPQRLASDETVQLEKSAGHYLSRVLRLAEGDQVTLFNGDGWNYRAKICGIRRDAVQVRIDDARVAGIESPLKITLVQAISRGERMDYSIQKATELGVSAIQPLTSHRVEVRLDEKRLAKRMTHWQGVATSACEQSGRATIPEIRTPVSLTQWISGSSDSRRLVLSPLAETSLSSLPISGDTVSVLIGPEGGFSDEEINALKAAGIIPVSLGPRVLRTETAGPAAIAVLQAVAGDM
jgi:16S rRNA (uracil1498-N3)-methyltransferase